MLELVAFAEPVAVADLATLVDLEMAQRLERSGWLRCEDEGHGSVNLGQPLYGDVLRKQVPRARAKTIASMLAERAESNPTRSPEDVLRIGRWRLLAGGGEPTLLIAAAEIARWRYDFDLAERLACAARDLGSDFEAELLLDQLAGLRGRRADAREALAALADRADLDPGQRSRVAIARLDNLWCMGRPVESIEVADLALAQLGARPSGDHLLALRSTAILQVDGPQRALEALPSLPHDAQDAASVWTALVAARSLCRVGRLSEALVVAERGHAQQRLLVEPLAWYPWFHLLNRGEALLQLGRLGEAEALAGRQRDLGLLEGSPEAQAHFGTLLARVLAMRGRVTSALHMARQAVAAYQLCSAPIFMPESVLVMAEMLAFSGRPDEAATAAGLLDAEAISGVLRGAETSTFMHNAVDLLQSRAWVAAACGSVEGACALLDQAAWTADRIGDAVGAVAVLHALARLGRAEAVVGRMRVLAPKVEGVLASCRVNHVVALAYDDGAALLVASRAFEDFGADLLAAEAAADAARVLTTQQDSRAAAAAGHRADVLMHRCEDATSPVLRSLGRIERLTQEEERTALLARTGQSNKAIARELVLSVRGVENRLRHIYAKLGISGRQDLRTASWRKSDVS